MGVIGILTACAIAGGAVFALAPFQRKPWAQALLAAALLAVLCGALWVKCSPSVATVVAVAAGVGLLCAKRGSAPTAARLGRARFPLYAASVATLAALVFVYLPIIAFLTSPGELDVQLDYLARRNARDAMAVVYCALFLYAACTADRLRTAMAFCATSVTLVAIVYSFALPFGYPNLNGLMFEQVSLPASSLAMRATLDAAVVGAGVVLAGWAVLRVGARRILLGLALLNVSLSVAVAGQVWRDVNRPAQRVDAGYSPPGPWTAPLQFSPTSRNVLILFLDRFMGGHVEAILRREPALVADLDGFTWVPKTVAAGENSIAGLHPLLGGYDYTPREMNARDQPLRVTSSESFAILPFNFLRAGWGVSLLNPRGLGFTMEGDCEALRPLLGELEGPGSTALRCGHVPLNVFSDEAKRRGVTSEALAKSNYSDFVVLLSVMRAAPYALKAVVAERGPWRPFLDHSAATTFRDWAELRSLSALAVADARMSQLNVVFNKLPHEPYFLSEDCLPVRHRLDVPPDELRRRGYGSLFELQHENAARCSLLLVRDFLGWMKAEGVYDNTMVVVVSDHGIVGTVNDHSARAVAGGTSDSFFVRTRSVLLVKQPGARGPLRASEEFLPNAEVPRLVCESIGGCVNPFLGGKTIEAHGRDDPFFVDFVPWQFNAQESDAFRIREEFALTGKDPYRREGWRRVR